MLRYFRQNDPLKVFGLIVLLLLTRLVYFIFLSDQILEVQSSLNLSNSFSENTGPLFSSIEFLLSYVLSNEIVNVTLASVLLLYNSTHINKILIRNSAFEENTYIPAALYIILSSFSETNYFLGASLLGSSFIIIGLGYLLQHLRYRSSDSIVLSLGFCIGLATLTDTSYFWFLILVVLIFVFYSKTVTRRYLLLLWGFIFSLLVAWLVFFYQDAGQLFWQKLGESIFTFNTNGDWLIRIGIILGLPILLSLAMIFNNLGGIGKTNLQITIKNVFSWLFFVGSMSIVLQGNESFSAGLILIIPMSYFLTDWLLTIERKWLAEILLVTLIVSFIALQFFGPLY